MSLPGIQGARVQRMGPDPTAVPLVIMVCCTAIRPFDPYPVTLPYAGLWRLVVWGAGGIAYSSACGGQSGGLYIAERHLDAQQPLLVRPGTPSQASSTSDSYVILPTGEEIRAVCGRQTSALEADRMPRNNSNDIVFEGSTYGAPGKGDNVAPPVSGDSPKNGAGAPGWGPHQGGQGGYGLGMASWAGGSTPGGGGGWYDGTTFPNGGQGQIHLCLMRLD